MWASSHWLAHACRCYPSAKKCHALTSPCGRGRNRVAVSGEGRLLGWPPIARRATASLRSPSPPAPLPKGEGSENQMRPASHWRAYACRRYPSAKQRHAFTSPTGMRACGLRATGSRMLECPARCAGPGARSAVETATRFRVRVGCRGGFQSRGVQRHRYAHPASSTRQHNLHHVIIFLDIRQQARLAFG